MKRWFAVVLILGVISLPGIHTQAATVIGNVPTGLVELTDYKYPVYLYIPEAYDPSKAYPMLIAFPGEGQDAQKVIEQYIPVAKRKEMIILAPTFLMPEEIPYNFDTWVLDIKKSVEERYNVSPTRTYLMGRDTGAAYAVYLGLKYGEKFSAVAALGKMTDSRYDKISPTHSSPALQVPFYVVLPYGETTIINSSKDKAAKLEAKGYSIYLVELKQGEDVSSREVTKQMMTWFEDKGTSWQSVRLNSKKTIKDKIKNGIEEFFKI